MFTTSWQQSLPGSEELGLEEIEHPQIGKPKRKTQCNGLDHMLLRVLHDLAGCCRLLHRSRLLFPELHLLIIIQCLSAHNYLYIMLILCRNINRLHFLAYAQYHRINIRKLKTPAQPQSLAQQSHLQTQPQSNIHPQTNPQPSVGRVEKPREQRSNPKQEGVDWVELERQKIGAPPPQHLLSNSKMSKQAHYIHRELKTVSKPNDLYHLFRKHRHKIRIDQMIAIFEKFVKVKAKYRDAEMEKLSSWEDKDQKKKINQDKFDFMVNAIELELMKKSQAPELYIKFIDSCSRIKDEREYIKCYPIMIRVIKAELSPSASPSETPTSPKKPISSTTSSSSSASTTSTTLPQLIPIDYSIRLLACLLRILSNPYQAVGSPESVALLGLVRESIQYIHLPTTSSRVENVMLLQLIQGYMKLYPELKLAPLVLKSIVKEVVRRVRFQGIDRKVKDGGLALDKDANQREMLEKNIVSSVRKLLILEKLIQQQAKPASLRKQLLETKENNLIYNPFYLVQYKLSKHITDLLPRSKFIHSSSPISPIPSTSTSNSSTSPTSTSTSPTSTSPTSTSTSPTSSSPTSTSPSPTKSVETSSRGDSLPQKLCQQQGESPSPNSSSEQLIWGHSELMFLLIRHIENMFTKYQIDVLAKCDLLVLRNDQYQAIAAYLRKFVNFYLVTVRNNQQLFPKYRANVDRFVTNSTKLMYCLLSPAVYQLLPEPLSAKYLSPLLTSLTQHYPHISPQLQSVLMWHRLRTSGSSQKVVCQLVEYLVQPWLSAERSVGKDGEEKDEDWGKYHRKNPWYALLLMGNHKYEGMLEGKQNRDMQAAFASFKALFEDADEYLYVVAGATDASAACQYIGHKFGVKIKNSPNKVQIYQKLTKFYQSLSISNIHFSEQEIGRLQKNKNKITQPATTSTQSNTTTTATATTKSSPSSVRHTMPHNIQVLRLQIGQRVRSCLSRGEIMLAIIKQAFPENMAYWQGLRKILKLEIDLLKYDHLIDADLIGRMGKLRDQLQFGDHGDQIQVKQNQNLQGNGVTESTPNQV